MNASAVRYCGGTLAYTAVMILIVSCSMAYTMYVADRQNAMSPPHVVGLANGLAQSTVSFARFFGPVIGGGVSTRSIPKGIPRTDQLSSGRRVSTGTHQATPLVSMSSLSCASCSGLYRSSFDNSSIIHITTSSLPRYIPCLSHNTSPVSPHVICAYTVNSVPRFRHIMFLYCLGSLSIFLFLTCITFTTNSHVPTFHDGFKQGAEGC